MNWLATMTDRMVLRPSTHRIENPKLKRDSIVVSEGELELWTSHVTCESPQEKLLVIKFPGTGGRAENSTSHPAEAWDHADSILWTINPFGYGGSTGPATLQSFPQMIEAVASAARTRHPTRKMIAVGNSLGSISALSFAAQFHVAAVILKNPVPIHQMIAKRPRYCWPTLGLSRVIASQIPRSLDAIANAKKVTAPAVVVSAQRDRVVPVGFQNKIIQSYGGDIRVLKMLDAGHHDRVSESQERDYLKMLHWLFESLK